MAGNIIELHTEVPAELEANVFGQFDEHLKLIERTLNVTVISRDGILKILGNEQNAASAKKLIEELTVLAKRGNTITKQNVNYALSLAMEQRNEVLTEIDKDFICNTIQGRPIKPKTLGQKDYVEQIRKKMIVFGVGPAGTGKTYLAMAMAVTAFRNEEVSRIILTRPAIEAGEKLGFLPGDLQSKVDPYLRPLYDALYQIMGAIHLILLFIYYYVQQLRAHISLPNCRSNSAFEIPLVIRSPRNMNSAISSSLVRGGSFSLIFSGVLLFSRYFFISCVLAKRSFP